MAGYLLGTPVTLFNTFFDENGDPADPTTVTFKVERPDNTVETFIFGIDAEVTNPSTGYYEMAYVPSLAGTFNYRIEGAGAIGAVYEDSLEVFPSLLGSATLVHGPSETWIGPQDVAECCEVDVGSAQDLFEGSAVAASQALYELSARRFPGTSTITVRPDGEEHCQLRTLDADLAGWDGGYWMMSSGIRACGCVGLSRILLRNQPVVSVTSVKVDGIALATTDYLLQRDGSLIRAADTDGNRQFWPSCQRLALADTEVGTFSVTYVWGVAPPELGVLAAAQLACEIYKACPGNEGVANGECKIPRNAVRVARQGVTVDLASFYYDSGRRSGQSGWKTGLNYVDWFLNTYNPHGLRRAPMIWSPDGPRHARLAS